MEYYAGLDVSLKSTHICVMDRDRRVVWRGSVDTQPSMVGERLKKGTGHLGASFTKTTTSRASRRWLSWIG